MSRVILAWLHRRTYVLSGRRPKPDVGNLHTVRRMRLYRCRLDIRACHPADKFDRAPCEGFPRPASGLFPEANPVCAIGRLWQVGICPFWQMGFPARQLSLSGMGRSRISLTGASSSCSKQRASFGGLAPDCRLAPLRITVGAGWASAFLWARAGEPQAGLAGSSSGVPVLRMRPTSCRGPAVCLLAAHPALRRPVRDGRRKER